MTEGEKSANINITKNNFDQDTTPQVRLSRRQVLRDLTSSLLIGGSGAAATAVGGTLLGQELERPRQEINDGKLEGAGAAIFFGAIVVSAVAVLSRRSVKDSLDILEHAARDDEKKKLQRNT